MHVDFRMPPPLSLRDGPLVDDIDQFADGQLLLSHSVARGEASSVEEVALVNDLVAAFEVHRAAVTTVLPVLHEISGDDAVALTSGKPPSPELRQLLLRRCLKAMVYEGALGTQAWNLLWAISPWCPA